MFSFLEDEHPFVDFLYLKNTTTQIRKLTMCLGKPGLATGGALFWGWDWRAPILCSGQTVHLPLLPSQQRIYT